MDIDTTNPSSGTGAEVKENDVGPVSPNASGEGFPYAPQDWPNPGDNWRWKVGKRTTPRGFHMDRYLYLPSRLRTLAKNKQTFASKLSVQQYIQKEFPSADVDGFFASFRWKIPSKKHPVSKGNNDTHISPAMPLEAMVGVTRCNSESGTLGCKAGNTVCSSLLEETNPVLAALDCNICCSEPGFCRYCCCILCCKTINPVYGGYSFVKCESKVGENYICAHVAHIECALRSYLAGTVGGSIGLDAEYYCRRCDARMELVSHVTRLLQTSKSIDSKDEIEKILNVGFCILRNSQKESAKRLLNHIELVMAKLKSCTCLGDIWKEDEYILSASPGSLNHGNNAPVIMDQQDAPDVSTGLQEIRDGQPKHLELEDEIDQILYALRRSQESEYEIAELKLHAQKNHLLDLYQQLENERTELSRCSASNNLDALLCAVLSRENQIKRETMNLRDMEEVAKGFGRTSKAILRKHYGLETED